MFGHSYGAGVTGTLRINGEEKSLKNERSAIEAGLAYVTEDRKDNGLVLMDTIAVNNTMARLEKICSKGGVIDIDKENAVAEEYKEKLGTKTPTVQQSVGNLSGGNQQKVLLSKWMFADPDILILDEPTRGIDVGAKYEIYCIMNDLIAQGKSVVMISSEMPELLGMCDRIYVMNEGRIVAEFTSAEATQEKIMQAILSSDKIEDSKEVQKV
jgi:putative multiple sugar transport system ATP-binding protein